MFGLVVSADAFADESLLGFIHRLAHLNALPGCILLKTLVESDADDLGQWLAAQKNAHIWSGMIDEVRNPVSRPIRVWNHSSCMYCPECLDEDD